MDELELDEAVTLVARIFERRKVRYALIGGIALGIRSRPRATYDADFILQVSALSLPGLLEDLKAEGFSIEVAELIRRWQTDKLIVIYHGPNRIDCMQAVIPLYAEVMDHAVATPWFGSVLQVATAEDLVLTKMIAFRLQDQADIVTLLASNHGRLDLDYIRKAWSPFDPSLPERTKWLEDAIAENGPV